MSKKSVFTCVIAITLLVSGAANAQSQGPEITKIQEFKTPVSSAFVRPDGKLVVICKLVTKNGATVQAYGIDGKLLHKMEVEEESVSGFSISDDWEYAIAKTTFNAEPDYALNLKSGKINRQEKPVATPDSHELKSPDGLLEATIERQKEKGITILRVTQVADKREIFKSAQPLLLEAVGPYVFSKDSKRLVTTWSSFTNLDKERFVFEPIFQNGAVMIHDLTSGVTLVRHLPDHEHIMDRERIEDCVAQSDGDGFLILTRTQSQEWVTLYLLQEK